MMNLHAEALAGKLCQGPDPHPRGATRFVVPPGAVDTHAHVIGTGPAYPLVAARSYTAPEATSAAYLAMLDATGMANGVLVQVSVHGTDNRLMVETLKTSNGRLKGIGVVEPDVSDGELEALAAAGVVGLRINVLFGGGIGFEAIEPLARRIAPLGWHLQFLIDGKGLIEIGPRLESLPVPFVIDHMGYADAAAGVGQPGFQALLNLLRNGDGWVKLSGAYRLSKQEPSYPDTIPLARALIEARPDRCVWGSDWPHVAHDGRMPNVGELLDLMADWALDEETRKRILVDNPRKLYGFGPV